MFSSLTHFLSERKEEKKEKKESKETKDMQTFVPKDSKIRKKVKDEEIDAVKYYYRGKNETELIHANIRNVLFCGATRSGKTTCFRVLQDPCYCPESSSIFSETRDTNFKAFSLKNNKTKDIHSFILSMIDSPGTFEIQANDAEFKKRSNEKITDLIIECLKHEVTYLNLVVLFMPISSKVDDRDIKSIELFVSMFKNHNYDENLTNQAINDEIDKISIEIDKLRLRASQSSNDEIDKFYEKIVNFEKKKKLPMLLCLTHADKCNEDKRQHILNEIKKHPDLTIYFENNDIELIFMGCVDHKFQDYPDQDTISDFYELVFN